MSNTGRFFRLTVLGLVGGSMLLAGCGQQKSPTKKPTCTASPRPTVAIPASWIHVNVVNATGSDGLAGRVATALSWRGYQVIGTASDPQDDNRPTPSHAEIRYGSGGYQIALTLASQVPHSTLYEDDRGNPSVDLVLGSAFQLAQLPPPAAKGVTVSVFNTTPRPGLATSVGKDLQARGFKLDRAGNDPLGSFLPSEVALVRYGDKGEPAARRVALSVKGAKLVLDGRNDSTVDLVLGNRFTALVPAASATPAPAQKPALKCT